MRFSQNGTEVQEKDAEILAEIQAESCVAEIRICAKTKTPLDLAVDQEVSDSDD